MKKIFIILILLLIFTDIHAQVNLEWVSRYDENNKLDDEPHDMLLDQYGNLYIVGEGFDHGNNNNDIIVIKYNNNGELLWDFVYNGPGNLDDVAYSCVLDAACNLYVTGKSIGIDSVYEAVTMKLNSNGLLLWNRVYPNAAGRSISLNNSDELYVSGFTNGDIFLLKYNNSGDLIWERIFNYLNNSYEEVTALKLDKEGNIHIAGTCEVTSGEQDILIVKYSSSGRLLWSNKFGLNQNYDNYLHALTIDSSNNVYLTGFSENSNGYDCITLKYLPNGDLDWHRVFNGGLGLLAMGMDVKIDNYENIIVAGQCVGTSYNQAVLLKYDQNGVLIWSSFRGDNRNIGSVKLTFDNAGNNYVLCFCETGTTNFDYLILKFDNSGTFIWSKKYDVSNSDFGSSILVDFAGNIYVTGVTLNADFFLDITTIKYSQPIGISEISIEIPKTFSLSQNYPNPFNPSTKITFGIPASSIVAQTFLSVYDLLGREVAILVNEELKSGTYEVEWDASNYPSGMYFYKLSSGEFTETKKMILLK